MNQEGKLVIPLIYENASCFPEGFAATTTLMKV
ncbi:MAG: WG repeat-containing protein [Flavisolibacter sp.]|nr:WG repeat-containing protein [Flavisolibacter sp.]